MSILGWLPNHVNTQSRLSISIHVLFSSVFFVFQSSIIVDQPHRPLHSLKLFCDQCNPSRNLCLSLRYALVIIRKLIVKSCRYNSVTLDPPVLLPKTVQQTFVQRLVRVIPAAGTCFVSRIYVNLTYNEERGELKSFLASANRLS
jgi:hypothetical protein